MSIVELRSAISVVEQGESESWTVPMQEVDNIQAAFKLISVSPLAMCVVDVDGTLLKSHKHLRIAPQVLDTLQELSDDGHHLFIASNRPIVGSRLAKTVGEANVFRPGPLFLIRRMKNLSGAIHVANNIPPESKELLSIGGLIVVGDRQNPDRKFAEYLDELLKPQAGSVFLKVPNLGIFDTVLGRVIP